jgi:hypothetical protein
MGAEIGIYILKSVTLNIFDYETANLIVLITKRFG